MAKEIKLMLSVTDAGIQYEIDSNIDLTSSSAQQ